MPSVAIIDDDHDVRDALVELFQRNGFRAFGAGTAEAALRLLGAIRTDLVITDYALPDRTGVALVEAIRDVIPYGRALPVILLSGKDRPVAADRALTFVAKPPDVDDLVELAKVLSSPP